MDLVTEIFGFFFLSFSEWTRKKVSLKFKSRYKGVQDGIGYQATGTKRHQHFTRQAEKRVTAP